VLPRSPSAGAAVRRTAFRPVRTSNWGGRTRWRSGRAGGDAEDRKTARAGRSVTTDQVRTSPGAGAARPTGRGAGASRVLAEPAEVVLPPGVGRVVQLVERLDLGAFVQVDVAQPTSGHRFGIPQVLHTSIPGATREGRIRVRHAPHCRGPELLWLSSARLTPVSARGGCRGRWRDDEAHRLPAASGSGNRCSGPGRVVRIVHQQDLRTGHRAVPGHRKSVVEGKV